MRFSGIGRPLSVLINLWCRVTVVVANNTALICHELGGPGLPDLGAMDVVARLALLAGRLGGRIILSDLSPEMGALLELAGLPVELEGEAEGGEEALRVQRGEEEVHGDDRPTGDLQHVDGPRGVPTGRVGPVLPEGWATVG